MKIKILIFFNLLFTIYYLLFPNTAFAADPNFDIAVDSSYNVSSDGLTEITQVISITNKTEFYFTPTYTVSVGFENIENIEAYNADGSIPTTLDDKISDNKKIKLSFPKRYAGLGKTNTFTLKFATRDIAIKQGNIWEVTIPGIESVEDFTTYTAKVKVPEEFGMATILKPEKNIKGDVITLNKTDIGKSGVYILYGDKQYYSFSLKYNISNPNLFPVRTEIALPGSTNYQNVLINSFSIKPLNVTRDPDGNWIAEFRMLPQQKNSVTVSGVVEILDEPLSEILTDKQIAEYTKSRKNWSSTSKKIIDTVKELKDPHDIYNFVVKSLSYNYSKVSTDNLRLGGEGALLDPKNSVCLEFTDLFITLARAKGIPARAVEGYAYTQDSRVRPRSLANDILHAWPEYYDASSKKWIMVDPTWGNTTKGMDYFNSFDFSHVTFIVKGLDSEYPIPAGGYKFNKESKDVVVGFSTPKDFVKKEKIEIVDTFPNFSFPKVNLQGSFIIQNEGNAPLVKRIVNVRTTSGTKKEFLIDYIPPGGSKIITTTFNDVPFLTNGKYVITIQVGLKSQTKSVRISFIPDLQILLFIGGLLGGSTIIATITYHTGSILIQRRKRKNSLRR